MLFFCWMFQLKKNTGWLKFQTGLDLDILTIYIYYIYIIYMYIYMLCHVVYGQYIYI